MAVFYGKMNNAQHCAEYKCYGGSKEPNDFAYFGEMQPGDLAFVRLQQDSGIVKRLWRLEELYTTEDGKNFARFSNVFSDGEFFNGLSVDSFSRLDLFKVGLVLGNKIWKQVTGTGFFKLDLTDEDAFNVAIANCQAFNQYIGNQNHYRKIVFVEDAATLHSDRDIQICPNGNSFAIYNNDKAFLSELNQKFNSSSDRYPTYIQFLRDHPSVKPSRVRKKVKNWLESKGTTASLTISNLWDFFCSQQPFSVSEKEPGQPQEEVDGEEDIDVDSEASDYKNLIIYGIPGCGKSYRLKNVYLSSFDDKLIVRTTFHPEYSNTDFVGQVRPLKKNQSISYEVVPGPFTEALKLALDNPTKKVALVIEEINRGNAAAIFGDLFQLLDRDQNGVSEYEIKNQIITEYLGKGYEKIRIPANLYLYATMNTSDQNVFKLDTAFKRRWEFERLTNKDTLPNVKDFVVFSINGNDVTWKKFIETINGVICTNDDISGDRQIGNFFYIGADNEPKRFANKVLEYLYNDVFKYGGREDVFNVTKYKSFDEIYDAFAAGANVFVDGLFTFEPSVNPAAEAVPADQNQE